MTTDTTANDPYAAARPRWLTPAILIAAVVLHVVLLLAFLPWAQRTMTFDPAEEAARTELVKQREQERLDAQRERRERVQLSESQAEKLKKEEQDKRRALLQKQVAQLERDRLELEAVRRERIEELKQRREVDVAAIKVRDLQEQVDAVKRKAGQVTRFEAKDSEIAEAVKKALENLDTAVQAMEQEPDTYKELAPEVAKAAEEVKAAVGDVFTDETPNHQQRHHAARLGEQADDLKQAAQALSEGLDMAEMNQTLDAQDGADASAQASADAAGSEMTPAELYEQARELEQEVENTFGDIKSAERAMAKGVSMADAASQSTRSTSNRPALGDALAEPSIKSIADLDRHRAALDQAVLETREMARKSGNLVQQANGTAQTPGSIPGGTPTDKASSSTNYGLALQQAARGEKGRVVNMMPFMTQSGGAGSGVAGNEGFIAAGDMAGLLDANGMVLAPGDINLLGRRIRINPDTFSRETLPGRMITDDADRQGWLYIDTWYVIGPWENHGRLNHEPPHPPEQSIDLDAVYPDGKFADQPDHPLHTLAWEFYQSDQVRCQPPQIFSNSTYYAYTEVYSDRDREVLFTISTDDAAKVWLNDTLIWEDIGGSPWQVGEGFRRVALQQGYNRLLVRIANGPVFCVWSVLFCPVELAD